MRLAGKKTREQTMNTVNALRAASDNTLMTEAQAAVAMDVCYTKLVAALRAARVISPYRKGVQFFTLAQAKQAWAAYS